MNEKVARLTFNTNNWKRPMYRSPELADASYIKEMGFGHEDWLFRDEWEIGGWRYAFLQGVNKSRRKLLRRKEPFDVTLFTVNPSTSERLFVAKIDAVECLTQEQSDEATSAFEERGWLDTMRSDIEDAQGAPEALGNGKYTSDIVNVRYQLSAMLRFTPLLRIPDSDPVVSNPRAFTRFQLFDVAAETQTNFSNLLRSQRMTYAGQNDLSQRSTLLRKRVGGLVEVSLEHLAMQRALIETLRKQHPDAEIVAEEDHIDVLMYSGESLSIYEIKSDLKPLYVIRQAIGQLLEYSFFTSRTSTSIKLFVGRRGLDEQEARYFSFLKQTVGLPLAYVAVEIDDSEYSESGAFHSVR